MTVTNARPSPFLTLNTDADWETITSGMGGDDGVILSPTTSLAPSLDTGGRNAVVAAGACVVKGKLWSCDAPVSTAIPAASGQNRIDRLVMRLNRTAGTAAAFIQPVVITGTPSGSPVIPSLVQTPTGNWDLPISHWTSTSAGGLTTLVDERFDPGQSMLSGLAANMPTWLVRPALYYQTDTQTLMLWSGSAWLVADVNDTWHDSGSMTSGWSKSGGYIKYKKTSDNTVILSIFNITPGGGSSNNDATTILPAGGIAAAWQPAHNHRVPVWVDVQAIAAGTGGSNAEAAGLGINTDGSIQCYGISTAATRLDAQCEYPLDV